ncbi:MULTISPECIES: aldehyde dehydrogenase family protein [Rhizobium]|uniref:aldehyde dehydrogenase family protein n=1 Tax=Rhizobium TaxID=379 RepID=UPI00143F6295|nr:MULTISPECIES: aldehyde dehydrogenase family protein [Rhizobium]MBX4876570.1 aldehyde dehydrogenase family protein [Rhizobium bangladeshense]MBX4887409.1 aldehyde dehydrogenase family protein [Rhizobium bangladeshense]MBX4925747.1 aldehyde dehydrogenase family protein [Rhizobium binae]MBX5032393.1 aldehyde dehydrogenase family protein [Rhizobium lentis]MBY3599817.1 aldehyde dehydrogenase family protein [Rhizobium bangladeshense]
MQNKLFIDGQWVAPTDGAMLPVIDPATEKVFHHIAEAGAAEADAAVEAAREAFDNGPWPRLSGKERAKYLRSMAQGIRDRLPELARMETRDNGKPLPESEWDIADAAGCFDFYADQAEELDGEVEEVKLADARFVSKVMREPLGVAVAIVPWNYPLLMASWKVAPALAAGCTMILKPAETTSMTALELGAIAEAAGLPNGVLNILSGKGSVVGQALVEHPQVDKIAFTGSGPVGSRIMAEGAKDIKRISLELGGKSPFVVFADSDLEKAVEWIMFGIFWNQGQVCSATSRVLVEAPLYPKLLARLVEEAGKIRMGNGLDEGTLLGPLVNKGQYEDVLRHIDRAVEQGATVACGGKYEGFDKGFWVAPTILTDMALDSDAWVEEIFGPVVCIRPFETEEEAIRLANDSRFGLAAAVMSADDQRCERVAAAFRAGIVWINCSQPTFTEAPWGGYKQSGIGRELGRWGLDNYLETKQITRLVSDEPWGWYLK